MHSLYEYKDGTKDKVGCMEEENILFMSSASVFIYKYRMDKWKVAWGNKFAP